MERISRRKGWLLFVLLSSGIAVLLGKKWLFATAVCPRLQDLLLYGSAVVIGLIGLVYVLITRSDSIVTQIVSILVVIGGILLFSGVVGSILGSQSKIQMVFCNPGLCDRALLAKNLREAGKLEGAEQLARSCSEDALKGIPPQSCQNECGRELSLTLYAEAGQTLDSLTGTWDEGWKPYCDAAKTQLTQAREQAVQYGYTDLVTSIDERSARLTDKCTNPGPSPTPSPTPVISMVVIRHQKGTEQALIDARVTKDSQFLKGLQASDFSLKINGNPVSLTNVVERSEDDPICMVAVVDNSGSIYPGLDQIKAAIAKLNDFRKPNDELGFVLFSARNQIQVLQKPAVAPLDPGPIDATGKLTALWDGVLEGMDVAQSCSAQNRYVVVLTDGADNDSSHLQGDDLTKAQTIAGMAIQKGIDICAVGVTDQVNAEALQAVATGCGYYPARNFDEVVSRFQDLFGYVRDFYRITFPSSSLVGNQPAILQVTGSGEVSVDFSIP